MPIGKFQNNIFFSVIVKQVNSYKSYEQERNKCFLFVFFFWVFNNICCQPQDGFSILFTKIEQGAIYVSLPSPVTGDLWNLLNLSAY